MASQDPIRLSGTSYAVLGLVRLLGEASPYDLKQAIGYSVENFWPVPHTTFYAEPERLARAGYLAEERETEGRRRKLYRLTDSGHQALEQWVSSAETSPPQLRDEATLKVFLGADPQAVYAPRIEWYQAKLDELKGYLSATTEILERGDEPHDSLEAVRTSLIFGTAYYAKLIEGLEESLQLIASSRPTISSA
jgi:PadR family transcriptional regulator AphA